jgi:hypothetical protein
VDFQIDCQLFLQLTDVELGLSRSELYVISEEGIRAWKDGFGNAEMAKQWGRSHLDSIYLGFARDARLDFPAAASAFAAWKQKNTEFLFPDWFDQVLGATDAATALTALELISSDQRTNHDRAVRRLCTLKANGAKAAELIPAEIAVNRCLALGAATAHLLEQLAPIKTAKPNSTGTKGLSSASQFAQSGGYGKAKKTPQHLAKIAANALWPKANRHGWTAKKLHSELVDQKHEITLGAVAKWLTKLRQTGTCL